MDAYSPVPVEGLAEAMGRRGTIMPLIVLCGGITGGFTGWFMQWFSATVIDYPYNVGGRPFNSWPMFIPIIFELTVLFAADFERGARDAFPQRAAPAAPPDFQRRRHRARHGGPFFPVPGNRRSPKWDREATRRFLEDELCAADVVEVKR